MPAQVPQASEEHREWWERFATRNAVRREVAAFLLGRSPNYVTAAASRMGLPPRSPIRIGIMRRWLAEHPDFRCGAPRG